MSGFGMQEGNWRARSRGKLRIGYFAAAPGMMVVRKFGYHDMWAMGRPTKWLFQQNKTNMESDGFSMLTQTKIRIF